MVTATFKSIMPDIHNQTSLLNRTAPCEGCCGEVAMQGMDQRAAYLSMQRDRGERVGAWMQLVRDLITPRQILISDFVCRHGNGGQMARELRETISFSFGIVVTNIVSGNKTNKEETDGYDGHRCAQWHCR